MPSCKRLVFFCWIFFLPAASFAQAGTEDITGLWTGLMYNDTTELSHRYEIIISEKNGKLSGFSHTYFIVEGKEYYGVKKLKVTREGNKIITQDMKLLANDYPMKPPKGVYMVSVLQFEINPAALILKGLFSTNATKKYLPNTGYIHVEKKTDLQQSALLSQLQQLGLTDEINMGTVETPPPVKATVKTKTAAAPAVTKAEPVIKKEIQPVATSKAPAAADINSRIIETIRSVNYSSDSLVLSLYDNGEVDGDTVTVIMNGQVIMPQVGLGANAIRKTIYTKDIKDSIQIVMYAETLGSLPPNTGLLIVYDGPVRYEIRFSGDLKKNAAIVFRKRNPL